MLLGLLDPSSDDTIDYVDGTEFVRCGGFLQGAIEGLHYVALGLQWNTKLVVEDGRGDYKSRVELKHLHIVLTWMLFTQS